MDNFELAYLLCRSNESTPILSPLHQLSLIPGPEPVSGVMSSVALEEVSEYQLVDVRNALLACPNVTQTTFPERPGLWFFEWRRPSRSIVVEVADFDAPEWPFWSGSALQTNCTFADLLDLWLALTRRVRAAWLHNSDCKMYSPRASSRNWRCQRSRWHFKVLTRATASAQTANAIATYACFASSKTTDAGQHVAAVGFVGRLRHTLAPAAERR